MNFKRLIAGALLVLSIAGSACAASPVTLTPKQVLLLNIARAEGIKAEGPKLASVAQTILMVESEAGEFGKSSFGHIVGDKKQGFGRRSYGVGQIRLATARWVLAEHPELGAFDTDEELIATLIVDHTFNIKVLVYHLKDLKEELRNPKTALLAYNMGITGAKTGRDPNQYLKAASQYRTKVVEPFNKGRYVVRSQ